MAFVVRLMVDREPTIGGHLTQSNGPVPSSSHGGVRSGSGSSGPPNGPSSGQRTSGAASISWLLSTKVGQAPRDGVVTGVIGQLLRIKWSTGEESTVVPGPRCGRRRRLGEDVIGQEGNGPIKGHKVGEADRQGISEEVDTVDPRMPIGEGL